MRRSVFIANFEQISLFVRVFPLLTLSKYIPAGKGQHCGNVIFQFYVPLKCSKSVSHCMKSVQIRSYFCSVSFCIRIEFNPNTGKYGPEITPNSDTFHAVSFIPFLFLTVARHAKVHFTIFKILRPTKLRTVLVNVPVQFRKLFVTFSHW